MKKLLAALICLMLCAMTVSATNIQRVDTIRLGQSKTVTIPQPTEPVDEGYVYFQQEFSFVPKTDGTYRMFISYVEDPKNPYNIHLDVSSQYLELENGIEFDAVAGEEVLVCFQYLTHDGRYPQFTFYLGTADETEIPQTGIQRVDLIDLGQSKTVTIPQPTVPVDEGYIYFQQEFSFLPKTDGTYRMFISYVEDPEDPYDILLDVPGPYLELENGIEFDAVAGEEVLVGFQYPIHDGRYPQFTFYLGTADETEIPQTGDMSLLPVALLLLTAVAGLSYLRRKEI